jgi:hypothetical protein
VVAGAVQLLGKVGVMMIVGKVGAITVTRVVTLVVLPDASVADALTSYGPGFTKVCETTAFPVTAPSSDTVPSFQSTVTVLIALPFCAGTVTAIVNVAGTPAFGGVVGGVMTIVGAAATLTVTVAVA